MAEKIIMVEGKRRRQRVEVFALGEDNTILTSLKGPGIFPELPGGGVDDSDSFINAAMRELAEEAGWVAKDYSVMAVSGDWVFKGSDDPWFNKDGWNEEENIAVVCNVIAFHPDEQYGSEKDHHVFNLIPINELIKQTNLSINKDMSRRKSLTALHRLAVLKELLSNELCKDKPSCLKW